jgi:hypothetical protein
LFDWIQLRLKTEIDLFQSEKTDDPIRRQKQIEAGHLELYQRDLRRIAEISGPCGGSCKSPGRRVFSSAQATRRGSESQGTKGEMRRPI